MEPVLRNFAHLIPLPPMEELVLCWTIGGKIFTLFAQIIYDTLGIWEHVFGRYIAKEREKKMNS